MGDKKTSLADFVATLEFKGTDKIKQDLKEIEDSLDRISSKYRELTKAYEIAKPVAAACGVTNEELKETLKECKNGVIKA